MILAGCAALLVQCAGGRANLKFDDLKYPCSSSPFLYGPNDEILAKGKDLDVAAKFAYQKKFWGIGWSLIKLSKENELVSKMNADMESYKADGMINLTIKAEQNGINHIPVFNLLPIWPGATLVTVEGEIVRRK